MCVFSIIAWCVWLYDFTVHAGLYKDVGVNVNVEVWGYYEKVLFAWVACVAWGVFTDKFK